MIRSKSVYFSFLDTNFGIRTVAKHDKEIILDVYGSRINFSTNKRLRIAFRILVLICCNILTLVFVDGCILSRNNLAFSAMCPMTSGSDCFYYESGFSFVSKPFYCPPNEPISATNITAELIICFTWEIKSQTVISILNQLGICSSILCILGLYFKSLCSLARCKGWGTILTIVLGLAIIIIPIILWTVFRIMIHFILFMILLAAFALVLNALFLLYIVRKSNNQVTIQQSTTVDHKHVEL